MNIPPMAYARPQKDYKLAVQTTNIDAQDNYTEVHALFEQNQPTEILTHSAAVQAVPTSRRRPTQYSIMETHNIQTQYEPQLHSEQKIAELIQSKIYRDFLKDSCDITKQALVSNHVADAVFAMERDHEDYDAKGQSSLQEIQNLQHKYTKNKTVTCFTQITFNKKTLIFQAVAPAGLINKQQSEKTEDQEDMNLSKYYVLIWNIADNMQPVGYLVAPAAVTAIDVAEKGQIALQVTCGTVSGQVLFYDLDNQYKKEFDSIFKQIGQTYNQKNSKTPFGKAIEQNLFQEYYPSLQTSPQYFHNMPVTDVKWIPANNQLTRSGALQTSANIVGASTQIVSVSPDGYIKAYTLSCNDRDPTRPDQIVLIPFLQIPCATIFPRVKQIKPITIEFASKDNNPSSLFMIGDAFGHVCASTWPAAVAGAFALDEERKKVEKQLIREMPDNMQKQLEQLQTFQTDKPNRGTLITGFKYFQSGVFQLEISKQSAALNMMMATSADGVQIYLIENSVHRQTQQYSMRGLSEEQIILQQNFQAGQQAGFIISEQLPAHERKFQVKSSLLNNNNDQLQSLQINSNEKQSLYKQLTTPNKYFVDTSQLLSSVNLNMQNLQQNIQQQSNSDITAQDALKKPGNLNSLVNDSLVKDFLNYDFYNPVFSYFVPEGSVTASAMSGSRPAVLYLGTDRGVVLVFDLRDRMYEPLIQANVCVGMAITHMKYVAQAQMSAAAGQQALQNTEGGAYTLLPDKKSSKGKAKDVLIVADSGGNIHVLEIPRTLRAHKQRDDPLRDKFRKNLECDEYIAYRQTLRKICKQKELDDLENAQNEVANQQNVQ